MFDPNIPGVNFNNVKCANFSYERHFGSFFLVTCIVKAAETTFVQKICTFNVDEIDYRKCDWNQETFEPMPRQ